MLRGLLANSGIGCLENPELFVDFLRVAIEVALAKNAAIYQWHAHKRQAMVEAAWEKNGVLVHQQII